MIGRLFGDAPRPTRAERGAAWRHIVRQPLRRATLAPIPIALIALAGCVEQGRTTGDLGGDDTGSSDGACAVAEVTATLGRTLQTEQGFTVAYPESWSATQEANLYSLFSVAADALPSADLDEVARVVISTEQRSDHAEAVERLGTIEAESDVPATSLTIGGWPAIQRCQVVDTPQSGSADASGGGGSVQVVTTAIAADALIIRLEGTVPIESGAEQIALITRIGQSVAPVATVTDSNVAADADGLATAGTTMVQVLEADERFALSYPEGWTARKDANLYMIFSVAADEVDSVDLDSIVRVVVHTERHGDDAAAAARLDQIAAESDAPVTRLDVDGWPALERVQTIASPQPGGTDPAGDRPRVLAITTAVAADSLLIRLETNAPPDSSPQLIEQVLEIGRSVHLTSATVE